MRAKLLIARQSYPLRAISNCRYCTLCEKLDGLVATGREQTSQLIELAISYGPDRTERTYSTLPSLATQPPSQESIAAWSEIVLVDSIATRIGILRLSPTSI